MKVSVETRLSTPDSAPDISPVGWSWRTERGPIEDVFPTREEAISAGREELIARGNPPECFLVGQMTESNVANACGYFDADHLVELWDEQVSQEIEDWDDPIFTLIESRKLEAQEALNTVLAAWAKIYVEGSVRYSAHEEEVETQPLSSEEDD